MKPIASLRFKTWKMPEIQHGKLTRHNWLVLHPAGLSLSPNTDIGAFTLIQAEYGVIIEEDVQIGSHCSIYSVDTERNKKGLVIIAEKARIGSFCLICPGVIVGEGAFIKAYCIIDADVPAGTIIPPYTFWKGDHCCQTLKESSSPAEEA